MLSKTVKQWMSQSFKCTSTEIVDSVALSIAFNKQEPDHCKAAGKNKWTKHFTTTFSYLNQTFCCYPNWYHFSKTLRRFDEWSNYRNWPRNKNVSISKALIRRHIHILKALILCHFLLLWQLSTAIVDSIATFNCIQWSRTWSIFHCLPKMRCL